jgi:hypothetical protein
MIKSKFTAQCLTATLLTFAPLAALAQGGGQLPQVSMVTLQVVRGQDRSEHVITPKGDLAPLPGEGVNGEAVRQSAYGHSAEPEQSYQKQQKWYQDQLKQNPKSFQKSDSNPFVSQSGFKRDEGSPMMQRGGRSGGGRRR